MSNMHAILKERGGNYGKFETQAEIVQKLKEVCREHPGWANLDPDMQEAIDMTLHKYGRAINGNPKFPDTWRDVVGYNELVAGRLEEEAKMIEQAANTELPGFLADEDPIDFSTVKYSHTNNGG